MPRLLVRGPLDLRKVKAAGNHISAIAVARAIFATRTGVNKMPTGPPKHERTILNIKKKIMKLMFREEIQKANLSVTQMAIRRCHQRIKELGGE